MGFRETFSVPGMPLVHRPVGQELGANEVVTILAPPTVRVTIAGAYRWKLRGLMDVAAGLIVQYCRPGGGAAYTAGNPGIVTIVGGTEFEAHDNDLYGEADLLISVVPNGILSTPLLAIDAVPEKFKTTNAITAHIAGVLVTKVATPAIVFSAAYVITGANKWGAFRVQMNAAGTISTKGAASAYATEALAIAALPAVDAGNVSLGYIAVQAKGATWTANTDDMTDGSDCVVTHFVSQVLTGALTVGYLDLMALASAG